MTDQEYINSKEYLTSDEMLIIMRRIAFMAKHEGLSIESFLENMTDIHYQEVKENKAGK